MNFVRAFRKGLFLGCLVLAAPVYADDASDLAAADKAFQAGEFSKAVPILQGMADRGSAPGMRALAIAYLRGQGVARDEKKGVEWMTQAADKGLSLAQHELGTLYLNGIGVEKNQETAALWFNKAAAQDFSPAVHALGRISTDAKQQEEYYRRAAKLASVGAMLDLAQILTAQAEKTAAQGPKLKALSEAYQWIATALTAIPPGPQRDDVHRARVTVEDAIKKADERAGPQIIADAKKLGESIAMEFRAAQTIATGDAAAKK